MQTISRILGILFALIAIAGCGVQPIGIQREQYTISAPFDAAQAETQLRDGVNTVRGNAFMRQKGGGVVTCAGQTVYLIPVTAYAEERLRSLYGYVGESASTYLRANPVFYPDPPEYKSLVKTTKCDSQGNFVFDRTMDGDFFIQVSVIWQVGYSPQGGHLVHRVKLRGGQAVSIIMAS